MTKELATTTEVAVKEVEFSTLRERLKEVLEEQKQACVRVNGRLEITRPVALAMQNQLARDIAMVGGNVSIKKEVLSFSPVVVKAVCQIELPNGATMHFEALGSAEESDIRGDRRIYHDTLGTAETRATKRLLEEVVGEDFINKVLTPIVERQVRGISEKQIKFIKNLARQTGARISEVSQQAIGRAINSENELSQISSTEATAIIQAYQNLQNEEG